MKTIACLFKFIFAAFLITLAGKLWYKNLNESHQHFVKNFVKQIPDLPGRYSL